jgi:hypothetical protein
MALLQIMAQIFQILRPTADIVAFMFEVGRALS